MTSSSRRRCRGNQRCAACSSAWRSWRGYQSPVTASQKIDFLLNTYYGFIGHLLNTQSRSFKDKDTISDRYQTGYNVYPTMGKEVTNIFKKLYELFTRCNRQKEEFVQNMQIVYRSLVNTAN